MTDLLYIVGGRRGVLHISAVKSAGASTPPPTVSSITANEGPIGGGLLVVVGGTNLTGVSACTIGGVPCTSVTPIDAVSFSCITPALTAGAQDVVATTPGGSSAPLVGGFTAFDITAQSWDALFLAPYAGSPMAGVASAGTSGLRSLSEATNPPTVGVPLNGKAVATYNGTTQKLTDVANLSTYITPTEGTATACIYVAGITGGSGVNGYDNPGILVDLGGGNFGLHVGGATNNKFVAYMYDAIIGAKKAEIAIALATWIFIQFRWKASTGTCEARLNGGAWVPLSGGAMTNINGTLASLAAVGRDYAQTKFFNGSQAALACSKTLKTDGELNRFRVDLNCRYGISV